MLLTNLYVFIFGLSIYFLIPILMPDRPERERIILTFSITAIIVLIRIIYHGSQTSS